MNGAHFGDLLGTLTRLSGLPAALAAAALLLPGGIRSAVAAEAHPALLRCEYRVDPLGIDVRQPRLSWTSTAEAAAPRGLVQTACQILVASSEENLAADRGDLWDTGRVAGDRSTHIEYAGKPLVSHQACFWKVRVWTDQGDPSPWSEPASWSMGILQPDAWHAQWIGHDEEEPAPLVLPVRWIWTPGKNPAAAAPLGPAFFRRVVEVPAEAAISKATVWMTADNEFQLLVNGQKAGEGHSFRHFSVIDVTEHLHPGRNLLAVKGLNVGQGPNPAGVMGMLRIVLASGGTIIVKTDAAWHASAAEAAGWEKPGFDDSEWAAAQDLGANGMRPWGPVAAARERVLPARWLRREFTPAKPIQRATAYVCGLGLFELYLNGRKVGNHVLEPALTEYTRRAAYVTFDVTDALRPGVNALGVILGNGRFYAPRHDVPTSTRTFGFPKLLLHLRLEYADGSVGEVVSDAHWELTTDGPIRANNEYDGEVYDARRELDGWAQPGFNAAAWQPAEVVQAPGGALVAQMAEPIRMVEAIKPVAIKCLRPGVFVFDMGQNMVGWCRLSTAGPPGTQIRLRYAETLQPDGSLYTANLRSAQATDTYICRGLVNPVLKGAPIEEVYQPRFTYHGFRYVEVSPLGNPTPDTLQGMVVHDAVRPAGRWRSSNELLNRLWQNIRWGVRGNYRSISTDCPQRDERQGWLGDRSAESKGETYLFDIAALYSKWLTDIEDAQKDDGSVPDVAPAYWPIYSNNVTWPSSFVIIPEALRVQYGEERAIARHYDGMKKWMGLMSGFIKDGIQSRDSYGDWCVPPESPELIHSKDPARKTAAAILGTTYFYHDLELMAGYAQRLGRSADEQQFRRQAQQLRAALNARFFRPQPAQYDNGSQTSSVLPLAFGMVPAESKAAVLARLVDDIQNKTDGHIGTGLVGGQWLLRVLSDNGRPDLAYTIATQRSYPSWGFMVDKGATTIWELWNGNTADPAMNSGNHVMLVGDLGIWMYEYLAGIRPDPAVPGFKHIVLRPMPVGDLTDVEASYESMYGRIASHWRTSGGKFRWTVTVPVNTRAVVVVPTSNPAAVTERGRPAGESPGVKFAAAGQAGTAVFEVGSGTYLFAAPAGN